MAVGVDRTIRSLVALDQSASSARVLNLRAIHLRQATGRRTSWASFFQCQLLNRTIIVKHRLRQDEYGLFDSPEPLSTKILIPIDHENLRSGAHCIFLRQRHFDRIAHETFGDQLRIGTRDRSILNVIGDLPSLDPFLLRESLKARKIEVAQELLAISEADIRRMHAFASDQLRAIASMSARPDQSTDNQTERLVDKLLSSQAEEDFGPLKPTLQLNDEEFSQGIFAWRGFLYYKWVLYELKMPMLYVAEQIGAVTPTGGMELYVAQYLEGAKQKIRAKIAGGVKRAIQLLQTYDKAYAQLTDAKNPGAFRRFILQAPLMFGQLGEVLGGLQHIVSFWMYRFPEGKPAFITPAELMDLFLDFEGSLADPQDEPGRAPA
jgi:hypothetical protein